MSDAAALSWGWWRERRLPAERIHLDSAAAGRSSRATLAATAAHAQREARDMTEPLLRISPHVDCTPEDLARLRQALLTLA